MCKMCRQVLDYAILSYKNRTVDNSIALKMLLAHTLFTRLKQCDALFARSFAKQMI